LDEAGVKRLLTEALENEPVGEKRQALMAMEELLHLAKPGFVLRWQTTDPIAVAMRRYLMEGEESLGVGEDVHKSTLIGNLGIGTIDRTSLESWMLAYAQSGRERSAEFAAMRLLGEVGRSEAALTALVAYFDRLPEGSRSREGFSRSIRLNPAAHGLFVDRVLGLAISRSDSGDGYEAARTLGMMGPVGVRALPALREVERRVRDESQRSVYADSIRYLEHAGSLGEPRVDRGGIESLVLGESVAKMSIGWQQVMEGVRAGELGAKRVREIAELVWTQGDVVQREQAILPMAFLRSNVSGLQWPSTNGVVRAMREDLVVVPPQLRGFLFDLCVGVVQDRESVEPWLVAYIEAAGRGPREREQAAGLLAAMARSEQGLARLVRLYKANDSPSLRARIVSGVGVNPAAHAVFFPVIREELIREPNTWPSALAARTLGMMGEVAKPALAELKAMAAAETRPEVRGLYEEAVRKVSEAVARSQGGGP
jgi:hypothetical protein